MPNTVSASTGISLLIIPVGSSRADAIIDTKLLDTRQVLLGYPLLSNP